MSNYSMRVRVQSQFLPEQSAPDQGQYLFAYTVHILNTGTVPAQIISRHWVISDAHGHVEEVNGLGVVGHQPLLRPGEHFEYTSGCPLATPTGSMRGSYFCVAEDGTRFDVPITEFSLAMPRALH
ncbi:Co2+/Mg2+ efflux protein ApaG [Parvibium lacunae]|uniref:Protein ApaG n=1 Tax=Parvibium lacunae TaxID=1888893 RepID=A0A368L4U1_9BURK|nr:Co2+/Mg2+ efflux protein ApaG [Parvibium lacunae]RCS58606.1 Co2+/Mg2+ efflux protein ApaG [Parvibium lacunae]